MDIVVYTFLIFITIIMLYPFLYVVSFSLSDPAELITRKVVLFPLGFSLIGYQIVFSTNDVINAYGNTILYAAIGTLFTLIIGIITAYPLSKSKEVFMPKTILTLIYTFTMFFSGGLIPTFLIISKLGLLDTLIVVTLPGAFGFWNIILIRTNIKSLGNELLEAAYIDGASDLLVLTKIIVPLIKPILAVITLWTVVGQWNAYFVPLIYLSDSKKYPLQVILKRLLIESNLESFGFYRDNFYGAALGSKGVWLSETVKMAAVVITTGPIILFYPFVQKYFMKGIMIGSIKG